MRPIFNWMTFQHMTTSIVLIYFWTRWLWMPLLLIPLFILVWIMERNINRA